MKPTAALALVLGLSGCDNLFNIEKVGSLADDGRPRDGDGATLADAFVPVHCAMSPFPVGNPVAVPELQGLVAGDPFMSPDELELFFVRQAISPYEIWRASRSSRGDAFVVDSVRASFNRDGVPNVDPSMTLDGTLLVFVSSTLNGQRAFFTERTNGTWSTPAMLPGLEGATFQSGQISWDGLVIYFEDASGDLLRSQRATRQDSFGNPVVVRAAQTEFPSVSADELEVFASIGGIGHAARASTSIQFGGLANVLPFGKDPQLFASSTTLVISYDTSIAILERLCN